MVKTLKIYLADLTYDTVTLATEAFPLNVGFIAAYCKKRFGDKVQIKIFKYIPKLEKAIEEEPPDEDPSSDIEENSETEDFEVPHVELGLVIAILLLIFQVIRIRSFGGTKLAETENQEEGLEAEILD